MITMEEIERKVEELPLLPYVMMGLLQLKPEEESFLDKVLKLSQQDPTFALQIIRLANSTVPNKQIKSLQEAVASVAIQGMTGLIASMASLGVFVPVHQGEKDLWIHSIQVAVIASRMASLLPDLKIDPNQAYMCGLLHDIGRFVMFDSVPSELQKVEAKNWQNPEELVDAELDICGFDHSKLGGRVGIKWGLPETVRRVVAYHHMYTEQQQKAIRNHDVHLSNLLNVIQLADCLSMLLINEPDILTGPEPVLIEALKKCNHPCLASVGLSLDNLKNMAKIGSEETIRLVQGMGIIL